MKRSLVIGFLFLLVFFIVGFWDVGPYVLMGLLIPLLAWSIYIIRNSRKRGNSTYFRILVIITGIMGILFTMAVCYGIIGMMGYYKIENAIYLGLVISSFLGLILGILLCLINLWIRSVPKQ